ncbi:MAG TPA: response regulator [Nitrospina sp.]|jgi:DNA-binding response OmpR family regulator|nr:response regulator [Nitrospina sp.]
MNLISIRRRGLVHLMAQSKIQLVDDEIKTRQLLSRLLSNQGFIVQTASDGEKALIKANEFQPNCILLDVRMPHGGLGLLSRFRKKFPDSIIIMVSGIIEPNQVRDYLGEGAYACIKKPVDMSILLEKIEQALNH